MKKHDHDEIETELELAKRWKVSPRFLQIAREKYGLPYFKIGRNIRYRKSESNMWFEERKVVA